MKPNHALILILITVAAGLMLLTVVMVVATMFGQDTRDLLAAMGVWGAFGAAMATLIGVALRSKGDGDDPGGSDDDR